MNWKEGVIFRAFSPSHRGAHWSEATHSESDGIESIISGIIFTLFHHLNNYSNLNHSFAI